MRAEPGSTCRPGRRPRRLSSAGAAAVPALQTLSAPHGLPALAMLTALAALAAVSLAVLPQPARAQAGAPGAVAPGPSGYALGHPRRRPGLWEIRSANGESLGMPPTRFCVGEQTDTPQMHLDRAAGDKGSCTIGPFKRVGINWVAETVCRDSRTTVISQSVASGDFLSEYRIDTLVFYSPPLPGNRREDKDAVTARYVGPCREGQRAGDLEVPGMGTLNMNDGSLAPEAGRNPPARPAPAKKP